MRRRSTPSMHPSLFPLPSSLTSSHVIYQRVPTSYSHMLPLHGPLPHAQIWVVSRYYGDDVRMSGLLERIVVGLQACRGCGRRAIEVGALGRAAVPGHELAIVAFVGSHSVLASPAELLAGGTALLRP